MHNFENSQGLTIALLLPNFKVYLYGFLKISSGPNEGAFYHPKFIKENRESCLSIRRNEMKRDRRKPKRASDGSKQKRKSGSKLPRETTEKSSKKANDNLLENAMNTIMDGCGPQMDITQMQQNGQPVSSPVVPGTVNSNPSLERGLLSRDCDQFMENSRLRLSAWPPKQDIHPVSCSSTMVPQEDNFFQNIDLGNDWLSGIEASAPLEENCDLTPRPIEHMLYKNC